MKRVLLLTTRAVKAVGMQAWCTRIDERVNARNAEPALAFHAPKGLHSSKRSSKGQGFVELHLGGFKTVTMLQKCLLVVSVGCVDCD